MNESTGAATPAAIPGAQTGLGRGVYDDAIVRAFLVITMVWGVVAFLVGIIAAIELAFPQASFGIPYITFGRLRPLHTNAAIFAFAGNAIFAAVYHSTQRLCKVRMWSDALSWFHFWGWQAIIVAAAITLPLGITQSREYAELEWPIDIAIAIVWVAFAINFFGTLAVRRERYLYVALWFYISTIITIAMLHIFNNIWVIAGPFKSYSVYAGVQDAMMQWWYGHNAVGFFLTTPFLGLMYYYMPKAAERPVFSYRLSIVHFWSLIFIYIWAGPHHLHYTAMPEWASTLGMLFSVMLWMPSWGGMLNGLLTLRGAWQKVATDPVLKFFVVGVTFYGMSTFEGPLLSIKSVNAFSHYTNWTIAHVHAGALGWVGSMIFGMMYWLLPRIYQTKLYSQKLANTHFWFNTLGIVFYILPIYVAGFAEGSMWRWIDASGQLKYPDFVDTVHILVPMYWIRVLGGTIYLAGALVGCYNLLKTWKTRPATYAPSLSDAPPLPSEYVDPPKPQSRLSKGSVLDMGHGVDRWVQGWWHRRWERLPLTFSIWAAIAVIVASLFEIVPTFLIKSNVPTIATVKPYTPLELAGRDIYVSEGCYNCHSQQIRPILSETKRYGEYSKPGEFVYDHPFQWGSRRIGPDLAREGLTNPNAVWHLLHFEDPRQINAGSVMPNYGWLLTTQVDFESLPQRMRAMHQLGVPYTEEEIENGITTAKAQAKKIADEIAAQDGRTGFEDKQVVALIAYLQRMGTDLFATETPSDKPAEPAKPAAEPVAEEPAQDASGKPIVMQATQVGG